MIPLFTYPITVFLLLNIKPTLFHYLQGLHVEPMNGINKDVSGVRLLPTTVLTYPMD